MKYEEAPKMVNGGNIKHTRTRGGDGVWYRGSELRGFGEQTKNNNFYVFMF